MSQALGRVTPDVHADILDLAEDLRRVIGAFVRLVRVEGETPRSAQSETLGFLDRLGPVTVAALADQRRVKHQSMRLVVAQLEVEGLVGRSADPEDRRAQRITLTETGAAALFGSRRARAAVIAEMLDTLPAEDRETLRTSVNILHRLAANTHD